MVKFKVQELYRMDRIADCGRVLESSTVSDAEFNAWCNASRPEVVQIGDGGHAYMTDRGYFRFFM